jgi:CelD/BcsL family acetyltransferase involved in cellulose biosynthesis
LLVLDVVDDVRGFKALHDEWNSLAHQSGTIFQTWEWSWQWWQSNKRGKRLNIVTARDGERLVGLAPLYVASIYYGLPVKVVSFLGTNGTDYLGFLLDKDSHFAAKELLKFVLSNSDWDAVDLHQLPGDDPALSMVRKKEFAKGVVAEIVEQDACYRLHVARSFDEIISGLSKKFRWNVQYYERRLYRDHDVSIRVADTGSVHEDMETFFDLHKKRFLDMKKPGAYLSPVFRRMHTRIATDMCKQDWLRLYIMEIDRVPVATLYGYMFAGSFFYYLGGFDPAWGKMSVSTVLIAHAIKQSVEENAECFDFLRGEEPYKEKWMAERTLNYRVLIHRKGAKSQIVKKMLSLENELAKKAKDIVQGMR